MSSNVEKRPIRLQKRKRFQDAFFRSAFFSCAFISILITVGIVFVLVKEALNFFFRQEFNAQSFLTGLEWDPESGHFGLLALLSGTMMTSTIAMLVAGPFGLGIGIYLSEYAKTKVSQWLKPTLELLAGIPSIVYGYFAINFVTPALQHIMGNLVQPLNALSAGLVMGILILPLVASMTEDALSTVPKTLKQAGFAMGATKLETVLHIILPSATSGIIAAMILAFSRAIGETMIVALAAGSFPWANPNPLGPTDTMTGYIVRVAGGDVSYLSIQYASIFVLGLILFLITLGLNTISRFIIARLQEHGE